MISLVSSLSFGVTSEAHYLTHQNEYGEFKLEFRSSGFKPAGKKAFNCWTGLHIQLQEFIYTFTLLRHQQFVLSEKLYHETLSDSEENEVVEKWMEGLLDDITVQVEQLSGKK